MRISRTLRYQPRVGTIGVFCFAVMVIFSPDPVRAQTCGVVWNLGDIHYDDGNHPIAVELWGATYGNGIVMASGGYGDVFTTANGINWTRRPSGYTTGLDCIFDVAYGNGVFVGAMKDSRILRSSNNGTTWSKTYDSGGGLDLIYAAYGNGAFVISGEINSHLRSTDGGLTWTLHSCGRLILGLAFGGGKFWGGGMGRVQSSTDGANWSVVYSTDHRIGAIAAGDDGTVVAAGHHNIDGKAHPKIYSSSDGINWTLRVDFYTQAGLSREIQFAAYASGVYMVGGGNGFLVTSTDGALTWDVQASGHGHYLFDGAYHEDTGRMVLVGNTSDRTPDSTYQYAARYSDCGAVSVVAHPANESVCESNSAEFCVTAIGDPPLYYQWARNSGGGWGDYSGATYACCTINPVSTSDAGDYRCRVWNSYGTATSNSALLTVKVAPKTFSAHPAPQTVCEFELVQFCVTADGSAPLSYQWERDSSGSWANAPNGYLACYTMNSVASADGGHYRCRVWNDCGTITSNEATLTVNERAKPDFDCDGDVDEEDFGHFQACLTGNGEPQNAPACADAKLDGDTDVDVDDFAKFLTCMSTSGPGISADVNCAD